MDKSTKIYPVGGPISQEKTKVWYHVRLDAEKSQQQYSLPKMEVKTSVYPHDYVSFVSTISISKKTKKNNFHFIRTGNHEAFHYTVILSSYIIKTKPWFS